MKQIILFLITISLFVSCGSIPKYNNNDLVVITTINQIEGEYENFADDSLSFKYKSLNKRLNWRMKDLDTISLSSVKIKVLDDKRMKIDFKLEDKILRSRIIKYRLRNNGFIKLKNNNFRLVGIPLVFGEYDIRKYQLGLNKENDLVLYGLHDTAGGILIILSSGFKHSINNIYKRI